MGLFDGPVKGFAEKICVYLDERVDARFKQAVVAAEANDAWERMKNSIVGEAISEVSTAIKNVAGIGE